MLTILWNQFGTINMSAPSCTTVETIINDGGPWGCKGPSEQIRGALAMLFDIASSLGVSAGGLATETVGGLKTAGAVSVANPNRRTFILQNQATTALFVKFGASASTTDYHVVLKGGSAAADGNGGTVSLDNYTGAISVASATTPSYTFAEFQ